MRWRRPEYVFRDYWYAENNTEKYEEKDGEAEEGGYFRTTGIPRDIDSPEEIAYAAVEADAADIMSPTSETEKAVLSPMFTTAPLTEARAAESYCYVPKARDGISDGFTWYLEKSAPGMTVAMHTGELLWTPPEGGYYEITLCARSLYGAESRQSWVICVRKAKPVRRYTLNKRFYAALRRKAETAGPHSPISYSPWRQTNRLPASPPLPALPAGVVRSPPIPLRL